MQWMLFLFGLVGKNDDFVTAHLHITAFNGKFLEGAASSFWTRTTPSASVETKGTWS